MARPMTRRTVIFPLPATPRKTMPPKPVPPWSSNDQAEMHWAERSRRVRAWRDAAADAARIVPTGGKPLEACFVRVTIPFGRGARRDPSNYVATCHKAIVDGLVDAGLWPDDTPEYVTALEPLLIIQRDQPTIKVEIIPRTENPYA